MENACARAARVKSSQRYPDTSPFSSVTCGRYWMAGLVASGAVLVASTGAWLVLGRRPFRALPPGLFRTWVVAAGPLIVGVPLITMTANSPTLPSLQAARVTLAALLGLALALMPGPLAAKRPGELVLLALDGIGFTLLMLLALTLVRPAPPVTVFLIGTAGLGSLLLATVSRLWLRLRVPGIASVVAAAFSVSYPLMALAHHVLGTDGQFYISDSDNFFLRDPIPQLGTWLTSAVLALGLTRLRLYLARQLDLRRGGK